MLYLLWQSRRPLSQSWLKKQAKAEGHFGESSGPTYAPGQAYHNKPGITAFALLALLKSDVALMSIYRTGPAVATAEEGW